MIKKIWSLCALTCVIAGTKVNAQELRDSLKKAKEKSSALVSVLNTLATSSDSATSASSSQSSHEALPPSDDDASDDDSSSVAPTSSSSSDRHARRRSSVFADVASQAAQQGSSEPEQKKPKLSKKAANPELLAVVKQLKDDKEAQEHVRMIQSAGTNIAIANKQQQQLKEYIAQNIDKHTLDKVGGIQKVVQLLTAPKKRKKAASSKSASTSRQQSNKPVHFGELWLANKVKASLRSQAIKADMTQEEAEQKAQEHNKKEREKPKKKKVTQVVQGASRETEVYNWDLKKAEDFLVKTLHPVREKLKTVMQGVLHPLQSGGSKLLSVGVKGSKKSALDTLAQHLVTELEKKKLLPVPKVIFNEEFNNIIEKAEDAQTKFQSGETYAQYFKNQLKKNGAFVDFDENSELVNIEKQESGGGGTGAASVQLDEKAVDALFNEVLEYNKKLAEKNDEEKRADLLALYGLPEHLDDVSEEEQDDFNKKTLNGKKIKKLSRKVAMHFAQQLQLSDSVKRHIASYLSKVNTKLQKKADEDNKVYNEILNKTLSGFGVDAQAQVGKIPTNPTGLPTPPPSAPIGGSTGGSQIPPLPSKGQDEILAKAKGKSNPFAEEGAFAAELKKKAGEAKAKGKKKKKAASAK